VREATPDFSAPPDTRWSVRGAADDLAGLLRRASDYLESLAVVRAVRGLALDRDGDDVVITVSFDHWQLPADLDYLDIRLARQYHYGEGQREDIDFMVELADELNAETIVDYGCGTGQLAVALARPGRRVIGVDPAKAMLDLAQTRGRSNLVEWIWGDISALDARDLDLAVMTGNIPSNLRTDDAWQTLLVDLHRALRADGHLAFGSWNPDALWEKWRSRGALVLPTGAGARVRSGPADGPGMELADGRERLYSGDEWRYRTHGEFARSVAAAGFALEQTYGDWQRSPLTTSSRDIVVVARRV
jgi:SAM-dependent methyltransferase